MSRPTVTETAEIAYAQLSAVDDHEVRLDYPLLRFVDAVTTHLASVDALVRDGEDGTLGWGVALDVDRAPDYVLPWLAQFVGVELRSDLDDESQRIRIREAAGWKRGSVAALRGAARQFLTGSRTVIIDERVNSPYHFTVTTRTNETLNDQAIVDAVGALKPAGLTFDHILIQTAEWENLPATHPTWDTIDGLNWLQFETSIS